MNDEVFEIKDQRKRNWFHEDNLIIDHYGEKIGHIGIALYSAYSRHANSNDQVWPGQILLCKEIGVKTTDTITKYNNILEKYKLIKINSGQMEGGSNTITLLSPQSTEEYEV